MASRLRELLEGEPFVAGDANCALTARIVQDIGFPAAYMGGLSTAMMHYALPDFGVFTETEMIEQAARVVEAIDIPLVVDADEAGDSVAAVHRTIRRYELVGVAGVHIEDETAPKHSPYDGPLLSVTDMQARITAAVEARASDDFVVMARTNEFQVGDGGGTGSLDQAVRRCVAYQEAGADALIAPFATAEQIAAMEAEVKIPFGGYRPGPGIQFVLSTGYSTAGAAALHYQLASYVFEHGQVPDDFTGFFPNKAELLRRDTYDDVVRRWAQWTGRPVREMPDTRC